MRKKQKDEDAAAQQIENRELSLFPKCNQNLENRGIVGKPGISGIVEAFNCK